MRHLSTGADIPTASSSGGMTAAEPANPRKPVFDGETYKRMKRQQKRAREERSVSGNDGQNSSGDQESQPPRKKQKPLDGSSDSIVKDNNSQMAMDLEAANEKIFNLTKQSSLLAKDNIDLYRELIDTQTECAAKNKRIEELEDRVLDLEGENIDLKLNLNGKR
jgi:hypothetical protein